MKRKYYILILKDGEVRPLMESAHSRNLLLFDHIKEAKRRAQDFWIPGERDAVTRRLDVNFV